jgi:hypothetical protein
MSTSDSFTTLDWIGAGLAALTACALFAFPFVVAPAFASMFADICTQSALPAVTRIALMQWLGPPLGPEDPQFGTAIPLRALDAEPPEDEEQLLVWLTAREAEHKSEIEAAWRVVLGGAPAAER